MRSRCLHHAFRFRKLGLGVDAAHFVLAGFDHHGLPSIVAGDADRIGQIVLALGIRIANSVQDRERAVPVDRHHAGIAQIDLALVRAGVGMLADRDQPVALDDEATIAGRIRRAKTERGNRSTFRERRTEPRKRLGRDQRRIAEGDQDVVHAARNRLTRRQHRVRSAKPLGLHEDERVGADPLRLVRDRLVIGADHDRKRSAGSARCGTEHMGKQRLGSYGMQNFRQAGAHARAFAGGEHDREA